jgi:hypothetical protein
MVAVVKYALAVLLMGYALFGRSMAYLGFAPIYVGEIVLFVGLLFVLIYPEWKKILKLGTTKWLFLLMLWGAIRTVPFIAQYGKDALRDGASWGYGFFALITASLLLRGNFYGSAIKWYRDLSTLFVMWVPIAIVFMFFFNDKIPVLPWGPIEGLQLFSLKGGDISVHLAGLLAFYFLVLPHFPYNRHFLLFGLGWGFSFIFIGFTGRAAFLTVSISSVITVLQQSYESWIKWFAVALLLVSCFALFEIEINTGQDRIISFEQLTTNVKSIFKEAEGFSGEGTKMWRILWWQKIIDYTIFGKYFWTGKGFGINLADDDGFQVLAENALRSPHNGHLTFLARAGVPGFFLWVGLQLSFALSLWKSYRRLLRRGSYQDASLFTWILVYWLAFMINGAFDVFFEGPQGGIWFWSVIGFGLSLIYAERQLASFEQSATQSQV